MSELHDEPFPKPVLMATLFVLLLTIGLAAFARQADVGRTKMPTSAAVESRSIRFEDRADGTVEVLGHPDGNLIAELEPGTNGFIRSVMRGVARERKARGIGSGPPFRLTRWADGHLSLEDDTTGRRVELDAFGPANAGAFAPFLGAANPTPGEDSDVPGKARSESFVQSPTSTAFSSRTASNSGTTGFDPVLPSETKRR